MISVLDVLRRMQNCARCFGKNVSPDYFFTTLDTCHAITTLRFIRELEKYGYQHDVCLLRHYFEQNDEFCNNVHLAGVTDFGFYKNTHGIRMNKNSGEFRLCMYYILKFIREETFVTLEVIEEDYLNIKNAPAFRDDIINFFSKSYRQKYYQNRNVFSALILQGFEGNWFKSNQYIFLTEITQYIEHLLGDFSPP